MNIEGKLIGETVVRGVELKLRELNDGGYRLTWSGVSVEGMTDLDGPAAAGRAWAEAITDLREDPMRDPRVANAEEPEFTP